MANENVMEADLIDFLNKMGTPTKAVADLIESKELFEDEVLVRMCQHARGCVKLVEKAIDG